MVKSFPLLFCLCLFISLLFAGCTKQPEPTITPITPTGAVLPFEVIEKEDYLPGAPSDVDYKDIPIYYPGAGPAVFVLAKKEDIQLVERHISTPSTQTLENLDFKHTFALVIFQGARASTGYGVEIQEIRQKDHQIDIFTIFSEPAPDIEKGAAISSPFEVVALPRNDLQGEYQFNLIVASKNILQITEVFP